MHQLLHVIRYFHSHCWSKSVKELLEELESQVVALLSIPINEQSII
jgi:hypothetical protein